MFLKACFFFLTSSFLFAAPIVVDLKNPKYQEGSFLTEEGGVIKTDHLRIQAQKICYTKKKEPLTEKISAEGSILVQYHDHAFVAEKIEFDLIEKKGILENATTFYSLFYLKGKKITLHPDGSFSIEDAKAFVADTSEKSINLSIQKIETIPTNYFKAENVTLRVFQIPTLWVPSIRWNLSKSEKAPLLHYSLDWDRGEGPRIAMRYLLYSWQDLSLFGRVEYRVSTGWGGALETEYLPPNSNLTFVTRSYVGTDQLQTAPNKEFRYRLEGEHHWKSRDDKTITKLTWDKYNDFRMPNDFPSDDFEIDTAGQTLFFLHHREDFGLLNFKVRPRANSFESIQQELPTLYLQTHPYLLGKSKILSFSHLKASYLDFAYSDQLASPSPLYPPLDYRSGRMEYLQKFYRTFQMGPIQTTPYLGGLGILYTNSPSHQIKPTLMGLYGVTFSAEGKKFYDTLLHQIKPYLHFSAISKPTTSPNDHYIFSIQDGYAKIDQLQFGFSHLFSQNSPYPFLSFDLYADAFFTKNKIPQKIPRAYFDLESNFPSLDFSLRSCWNFRNHILDYCNALLRWTINRDVALTLEGRYRSSYDFRKSDHDNFILDVTRSQETLLNSPASDRRIALLANLFVRLNPFWELQLASHHGFYRLTEDPYNEFKIDLTTWIHSNLKWNLSYSHTDKDDRVTTNLVLIKK